MYFRYGGKSVPVYTVSRPQWATEISGGMEIFTTKEQTNELSLPLKVTI